MPPGRRTSDEERGHSALSGGSFPRDNLYEFTSEF